MRLRATGFLRFLNKLLAVATVGAYLCVFVSPERFWLAGFATLAIPVLMAGQGLFGLWWAFRRLWRYTYLPLAVLAAGYYFVRGTVGLHLPTSQPPRLEVLSYNVHVFNAYTRRPHHPRNRDFVRWVAADTSHVKCFQEFYSLDSSVIFNTMERLRAKGRYHYYFEKADTDDLHGYIGLAIFSKFPIVAKGSLRQPEFRPYGGIYADLKVGRDTVRVYNIHLESMSIDERALLDADDSEQLQRGTRQVMRKLRSGFVARARQARLLVAHLRQCRHRVILCGDLNDLPYSHTYYLLRRQLGNAFESAGNGFGFSYNGRLAFLRIDSQFYSDGLSPLYFHTLRQVPYSDHFPLRAGYALQTREGH
jgi:endonuclease/exonuclease/phosphatase family metal-dependent hydrolase